MWSQNIWPLLFYVLHTSILVFSIGKFIDDIKDCCAGVKLFIFKDLKFQRSFVPVQFENKSLTSF